MKAIGREVREKGFLAAKTNIFIYQDGKPRGYRPGFGSPYYPELNIDKTVLTNLRTHLEALRDGLGPDLGLLLDLNFNAKTEGYLKILRAIADIDMFWVEIDSYSPEALGYIRRQSPHPISSCETLLTLREFLPYFREQAMDVAIIDTPWNGVWQSMKIAASAEAHEVNVAPHNFYGHLCTMMNAHFAAAVPNLRIMEIDIDRLPWDDELFDTPAEDRERPSGDARHARLGHHAERGSVARASAEERGGAARLRTQALTRAIRATTPCRKCETPVVYAKTPANMSRAFNELPNSSMSLHQPRHRGARIMIIWRPSKRGSISTLAIFRVSSLTRFRSCVPSS